MKTIIIYISLIGFCGLSMPFKSIAYSVLAHEAIVDANWDKTIQPLLLKKYPGSTSAQLKEARSYAYGGSVAPDMGYFPLGNKLFTNLVHYVRSGDFVTALVDESTDVNEYAFALGVLSHYYADNYGHSLGVNPSVPIVYPKMSKYGDVVTYAQNHISHRRMEFGFDVLQTARGKYVSQSYHDFIGFNVSQPVLERAFLKTYGMNLNSLFKDLPLSISTFRWTVKSLFPQITRTAWALKSLQIQKLNPGITSRTFIYKIRRRDYYNEFGRKRQKPGLFAGMLSMPIRIVPKRFILRSMRFKEPGTKAESLFIKSFDAIVIAYKDGVTRITNGNNSFSDLDFDTGKPTEMGEYTLADKTYNDLVIALKKDSFKNITPSLKSNILSFYTRSDKAAIDSKKKEKVMVALEELKHINTVGINR